MTPSAAFHGLPPQVRFGKVTVTILVEKEQRLRGEGDDEQSEGGSFNKKGLDDNKHGANDSFSKRRGRRDSHDDDDDNKSVVSKAETAMTSASTASGMYRLSVRPSTTL